MGVPVEGFLRSEKHMRCAIAAAGVGESSRRRCRLSWVMLGRFRPGPFSPGSSTRDRGSISGVSMRLGGRGHPALRKAFRRPPAITPGLGRPAARCSAVRPTARRAFVRPGDSGPCALAAGRGPASRQPVAAMVADFRVDAGALAGSARRPATGRAIGHSAMAPVRPDCRRAASRLQTGAGARTGGPVSRLLKRIGGPRSAAGARRWHGTRLADLDAEVARRMARRAGGPGRVLHAPPPDLDQPGALRVNRDRGPHGLGEHRATGGEVRTPATPSARHWPQGPRRAASGRAGRLRASTSASRVSMRALSAA